MSWDWEKLKESQHRQSGGGVPPSVDDIVSDSREFASQVRRDAAHVASAARRRAGDRRDREGRHEAATPPPVPPEARAEEPEADAALAHVQAWNPVILNRSIHCSRCGGRMARGERGYAGLSEAVDQAPAWLCQDCIEEL